MSGACDHPAGPSARAGPTLTDSTAVHAAAAQRPELLLWIGREGCRDPFPQVLRLATGGAHSPHADKHPPLGITNVQRHPALITCLAPAVPMRFAAWHDPSSLHACPCMVYPERVWYTIMSCAVERGSHVPLRRRSRMRRKRSDWAPVSMTCAWSVIRHSAALYHGGLPAKGPVRSPWPSHRPGRSITLKLRGHTCAQKGKGGHFH